MEISLKIDWIDRSNRFSSDSKRKMAANAETERSKNGKIDRNYEQLRKKYAGLESAYEQAIRRLDRAEATKTTFEQQHTSELMNIAGRIREKIQSLEMKQLRNGEDFEEFKQQLKYDLSRQYQSIVDELVSDLDQHRRSYADLRLQHSVLKSEFETAQKSLIDREEKYRLKSANHATQFDEEREALTSRIESLSMELAEALAAGGNGDGFRMGREMEEEAKKKIREELGELRAKYGRLEMDREKERNGFEKEMEELRTRLEDVEDDKQRQSKTCDRLTAELLDEQRKRESSDDRRSKLQHDVLELRKENELLRQRLELHADELQVQVAERMAQLEKIRDERGMKIEELDHELSIQKEKANKFENQYRKCQIDTDQMEQRLKRESIASADGWRDERLSLESRIRQLEHQLIDGERGSRENVQELQLALRRSDWEKEKMAEELALLRIAKETHPNAVQTQQTSASLDKSSDLSEVLKRLADQEQNFVALSKEFDQYRRKHDRFRNVLELVGNQMERTTMDSSVAMEDGGEVQGLIDELKGKVSRLMAAEDEDGGSLGMDEDGKGASRGLRVEKKRSGKEKRKHSSELM